MTTPVGRISLATENLRLLIADTPAFRSWVAEGEVAFTGAEALKRVHRDTAPSKDSGQEAYTFSELRALRPYALVSVVDFQIVKYAESTLRQDSGTLAIRFSKNVDQEIADDEQEIGFRFQNEIGSIVDGMDALSKGNPYLIIVGMSMLSPFMRSSVLETHTTGDYVFSDWRVNWGQRAGAF